MFLILGSVAWDIKGRETSRVFPELVAPESSGVLVLTHPELGHVGEEIPFSKWLEERADIWTGPRGDGGTGGSSGCGVWRWDGVILTTCIELVYGYVRSVDRWSDR